MNVSASVENVLDSLRNRHCLHIKNMPLTNQDACVFRLFCYETGKLRDVFMTGFELHIKGLPGLIANLSEAIVSLKIDKEKYIGFRVPNFFRTTFDEIDGE